MEPPQTLLKYNFISATSHVVLSKSPQALKERKPQTSSKVNYSSIIALAI
jgi:hypothetical protein